MSNTIIVTSAIGGVGKSSISSLLALKLSKDNKVLIIDGNNGRRTLDLIFNMEDDIFYTVNDYENDGMELEDMFYEVADRLYLLSATQQFNRINIVDLIDKINDRTEFDYIIVDLPSEHYLEQSDKFKDYTTLLISDLSIYSIRSTENIVYNLKKNMNFNYRTVLNRITEEEKNHLDRDTVEEYNDYNDLNIVSLLPKNDKFFNGLYEGGLLKSEGDNYISLIDNIIENIDDVEDNYLDFKNYRFQKSFFKRLFNRD